MLEVQRGKSVKAPPRLQLLYQKYKMKAIWVFVKCPLEDVKRPPLVGEVWDVK
jgi:hypothetical protein